LPSEESELELRSFEEDFFLLEDFDCFCGDLCEPKYAKNRFLSITSNKNIDFSQSSHSSGDPYLYVISPKSMFPSKKIVEFFKIDQI